MLKGTLYLTGRYAPGDQDWIHVYDIVQHDARGMKVRDGQNNCHWFPAHVIQRYSEAGNRGSSW